MKKIFSKIATLSVGLAMAIGVGVALNKNGFVETKAYSSSLNLRTNSHSSASTSSVVWEDDFGTMTLAKAKSSTNANNWIGGENSRTSTKFYLKQTLTIAPKSTSTITSAVFTFNSTTSVNNFIGDSGAWTNASLSSDDKIVTITPTNGAQSFVGTISGASECYSVEFTFDSTLTPLTIKEASTTTVTKGTPVTYSLNQSTTATWSLVNVNPEGCATISGSTVTAIKNGTATLVVKPNESGYIGTSLNLTISAPATHDVIPAGEKFYISTTNLEKMLLPGAYPELEDYKAEVDPSATAFDPDSSTKAWAFTANSLDDDAYNIVDDSGNYLYCKGYNSSNIIRTKTTQPDGYWQVACTKSAESENRQYTITYYDNNYGTKTIAYYADGDTFRYYSTSTASNRLCLIPVTRTLSDLIVSGTVETNYVVGGSFNPEGATVVGKYTSNAGNVYLDVTEDANLSWVPATFSSEGNQDVNAKLGDITSSNSFAVSVTASAIKVTSITPSVESVDLYVNETKEVSYTVLPANASDKTVTWGSSNAAVAEYVDGSIVAKAAGSCNITITANDESGVNAIIPVTVSAANQYGQVGQALNNYAGSYYFAHVNGENSKVLDASIANTYPAVIAATIQNNVIASKHSLDVGAITITEVTGGYTLKNSSNKYFGPKEAALGDSKVVDVQLFDDPVVHTIEGINNDGTVVISATHVFAEVETTVYLRFNSASNQLRARYYGDKTKVAGFTMFKLDKEEDKSNYQLLDEFVNDFMHPEIAYNNEEDTNACRDSGDGAKGYYTAASTAFNALSEKLREIFASDERYANPKARLLAWAAANGQELNAEYSLVNKALSVMPVNNAGTSMIVVTIVMFSIGIAGFGVIKLLKRRKED